jgi:hypothetical protein
MTIEVVRARSKKFMKVGAGFIFWVDFTTAILSILLWRGDARV